jgi:hypothetical protein
MRRFVVVIRRRWQLKWLIELQILMLTPRRLDMLKDMLTPTWLDEQKDVPTQIQMDEHWPSDWH